jgi:hypothetical protein
MYESFSTLLFKSLLFALLINAIASAGPGLTTYGMGMDCKQEDALCKNNQLWTRSVGIFLIVLAFFITSSILYFIKVNQLI